MRVRVRACHLVIQRDHILLQLHSFLNSDWVQMGDYVHDPAALSPEKHHVAGWEQSRTESFGKEKNMLSLTGIEPAPSTD